MRQNWNYRVLHLAICALLLMCLLPVDYVLQGQSNGTKYLSADQTATDYELLQLRPPHLERSATLRAFLHTSQFNAHALPKLTHMLVRFAGSAIASPQVNKRTASGSRLLDRWSMVFGSLAALSPVLLC